MQGGRGWSVSINWAGLPSRGQLPGPARPGEEPEPPPTHSTTHKQPPLCVRPVAGWKFWVPAASVNFLVVPVQHQVLYMSACGVLWTAYLSHSSALKQQQNQA